MTTRILTSLFILALMVSFCVCASAQLIKPADAHARLSENGHLYVGDAETPVKKLAARLKKDGIGPMTQVTIEIPPNTPAEALTAISRELASSGYRRILFSKPRKATAEKGEDPILKGLR